MCLISIKQDKHFKVHCICTWHHTVYWMWPELLYKLLKVHLCTNRFLVNTCLLYDNLEGFKICLNKISFGAFKYD